MLRFWAFGPLPGEYAPLRLAGDENKRLILSERAKFVNWRRLHAVDCYLDPPIITRFEQLWPTRLAIT
ncbi:hypothetical protein DSM3645_07605 [Blastopirellula marina DSM 3645]|uniref:Uncharacterized protein n=1 Tax=Blastopirellula marina DSM 3645 TaxID=314230 RepID=A3ZXT6_9BACT|nr:hypothetical protein DSM3645_07605 [Blastopirellula marina DSM 3645]